MSGGKVVGNSDSISGGGMYVHQGGATLSGTLVSGNSASSGGGAYVNGPSATLNVRKGGISYNSANWYGGGMYVEEGSATLSGTHVYGNTTTRNGGGLYLAADGEITAVDGCIISNSDTAVHRQNGTLTATDNWWGAPDGPSGAGPGSGDSVSANVDYANYKTSPPSECLAYSAEWHIYLPLVVRNH